MAVTAPRRSTKGLPGRYRPIGRLAVGAILVTVAAWLDAGVVSAQPPADPSSSARITIHAPHPEALEVALDEVELDWSRGPAGRGRAAAAAAVAVAGARLTTVGERQASFRVPRVRDLAALWAVAEALEAANPGAEAQLVLYEPGLPRGAATRRLLTREVGLVLEPGEVPEEVLTGLSGGAVRPVPGVPGGYVVEAADPLGALSLAEGLRERLGCGPRIRC